VFIDWLGIFCMICVILRKGVIPWNMHRDLLSVSGMKREISCAIRKGEKQIQILDGY
jgi:hypothetical protein